MSKFIEEKLVFLENPSSFFIFCKQIIKITINNQYTNISYKTIYTKSC